MSRKLLMVVCMGLMLATCKKQPANTDTSTTAGGSTPQAAASTSTVVVTSTTPMGTTTANKVTVEIHVQGLCAIADQRDTSLPSTSKSIIIPSITSGFFPKLPEHTPFIAWRYGHEVTPPGAVENVDDPLDSSTWRVHSLTREEVVLPDLKTTNPAASATMSGTCAPDYTKPIATATFDCFPSLFGFLKNPGAASLDPAHLLREKPSKDIAGRMEFAYGTLTVLAGDRCKWAVFVDENATPVVSYLANDLVYSFEYPENTDLVLKTRNLDASVGSETPLLTLRTPAVGRTMQLRLGNLMITNVGGKKSFPSENALHGRDDLHFDAFYSFFTNAGTPPVLHRSTQCVNKVGPFTPDVYCGPGYVH